MSIQLKFLMIVLFFLSLVEGFSYIAISQFLPHLARIIGLESAEIGNYIGWVGSGQILGFFIALLSEKVGRKKILIGSSFAGILFFSSCYFFALNLNMICIFLFLSRAFFVVQTVNALALINELFPHSKQSFIFAMFAAFTALGSVACCGLVPILINDNRWEAIFLVPAIFMVLSFLMLVVIPASKVAKISSKQETVLSLFSRDYNRQTLILLLSWIFIIIPVYNYFTFLKVYGLSLGLTESEIGQSIGLGIIVTSILIGIISAYQNRIKILKRIFLFTIMFWFSGVALYFSKTLDGLIVFTVSMLTFSTLVLSNLNLLTTQSYPSHLKVVGLAFCREFMGGVGRAVGPVMVSFGMHHLSMSKAMLVISLTVPIFLLIISKIQLTENQLDI